MGKEIDEDVVNSLETMLGLDDDVIDDVVEEEDKDEGADKDPVVPEPTKPTTDFTADQNEITKDIIKLELQIDELKNSHVDTTDFYDHLDVYLSEDEQALEFENKSAYMKIVAVKLKEYEAKHSSADELQKLEEQKTELENAHARSTAIMSVSSKYPDFNYDAVQAFFENKLNKEQQAEIYAKSQSYQDVYENAYKMYIEANPSNVQEQKNPKIPNLNNVRKQTTTNKAIDDGLVSDDEKLRNALGI
jgi:hypothetical protein